MRRNSYSDLIKDLKGIGELDSRLGHKVNELISINELLTTLNETPGLTERLDILLLTVLGQYGCLRGGIYIKGSDGWRLATSKGLRNEPLSACKLPAKIGSEYHILMREETAHKGLRPLFGDDGFKIVMPILNDGALVGLLCLGKSMLPSEAAKEKEVLLHVICDFGGVIIGSSIYHDDLEEANRQMQRQLFRLNTLYEITGAFARCYEDEDVFQILANTLMGQFFISRCVVLTYDPTPHIIFRKGLKAEGFIEQGSECKPLEEWQPQVIDLDQVDCDPLCEFMAEQRLQYLLPISSENRNRGLLLLGSRMDRKELSDPDRDFIISLCEQSAVAMENVRLQKEMLEKKRMEKELQLARDIQQKLLPKNVPDIEGYELAAEMRPYYQVGGDFYDFIETEDGCLAICLADVSGKSLPASMIMSTAQASLRALNSFAGLAPCDVITRLNRHLYQSTASNKFITMFYAMLNPKTHTLTYINCGHNHPIMVCKEGNIQFLGLGGMVLGMFPGAQYKVGEVVLEPGTEVLIYTDGLSEVTDPLEEEYGDDRLVDNFIKHRGCGSLSEAKESIVKEVMDFSKNQMVDDLTVLLIRRKDV